MGGDTDLGSGNTRTNWQTTDGSRIVYIEDRRITQIGGGETLDVPFYGVAKYPTGLTVEFTAVDRRDRRVLHPTRVTDTDGNFISIAYRNNAEPEIDTIIDTLNRKIIFKAGGNGRLGSVEVPELGGGRRTSARLSYTTVQLDAPFAGLNSNDRAASVQAIQAIYYDGFPGPGARTAYWFGDTDSAAPGGKSYSSYGMLRKVSLRRDMVFDAASGAIESRDPHAVLVTREQVYDYPEGPDPNLRDAPTYRTMTETWEGIDTGPAVTRYLVDSNASPRRVEITHPDNTRVVELSHNAPGFVLDGLPYQRELYDAGGKLLQKTVSTWTFGGVYGTPRRERVETAT